MEIMINKWIRETLIEYEKAKLNQNTFRLIEMKTLLEALRDLRDRLTISGA